MSCKRIAEARGDVNPRREFADDEGGRDSNDRRDSNDTNNEGLWPRALVVLPSLLSLPSLSSARKVELARGRLLGYVIPMDPPVYPG